VGPIDWAAIIGAASWVPQVTGWVSRKLTRPALRVIPSSFPEIGYTGFGPIFNLSCAISAEKKDAIIERVTAILEHERGQKMDLTWVQLSETFSEFRGSPGQSELVGKSQAAIALKISTLLLAEKVIGFNDLAFQAAVRAQEAVVTDRLDFLRKGRADAAQEMLRSKEFADLVALWERHFPWQEGRYKAEVELRIAGIAKAARHRLEFALSPSDVERLRQNLAEIRHFREELITSPAKFSDYKWNWVYPPFQVRM